MTEGVVSPINPEGKKWPAAYYGNHPGGRPRTVCPSPELCEELGKELLEWVKINKPTHLSEWFSIHKGIMWKEWNILCENKQFCPYYEQALSLVALNARNGTLNPSIAQRFLSLYHRDLKHEEIETAKAKKAADVEDKPINVRVVNYAEEPKEDNS